MKDVLSSKKRLSWPWWLYFIFAIGGPVAGFVWGMYGR